MLRILSSCTSFPSEASCWNVGTLGMPAISGGLLPLTRVVRTAGRSRVDSTLTWVPVFWRKAALMAVNESSSAPLHWVRASIDVTLGGALPALTPLLLLPPPQAASSAEAALKLRPAAVARCKNWRRLMLLVVVYSSTS